MLDLDSTTRDGYVKAILNRHDMWEAKQMLGLIKAQAAAYDKPEEKAVKLLSALDYKRQKEAIDAQEDPDYKASLTAAFVVASEEWRRNFTLTSELLSSANPQTAAKLYAHSVNAGGTTSQQAHDVLREIAVEKRVKLLEEMAVIERGSYPKYEGGALVGPYLDHLVQTDVIGAASLVLTKKPERKGWDGWQTGASNELLTHAQFAYQQQIVDKIKEQDSEYGTALENNLYSGNSVWFAHGAETDLSATAQRVIAKKGYGSKPEREMLTTLGRVGYEIGKKVLDEVGKTNQEYAANTLHELVQTNTSWLAAYAQTNLEEATNVLMKLREEEYGNPAGKIGYLLREMPIGTQSKIMDSLIKRDANFAKDVDRYMK